MKTLTILGATGTIGINTLDVVSRHPQRYRVFALSANRDYARMAGLCLKHRPRFAVMADADSVKHLTERLIQAGIGTEVLAGREGLETVAAHPEVDYVMAAIVGAAGLLPTLAAARAGKRVLLANKEALVMSGELFMRAVRDHGAELLPIDSEHNAVFQCMPEGHGADLDGAGVSRILLTGSGGPFRTVPLPALAEVTPEQACAHPNWIMGRKISVDSATMMNKGLEVIEACWLFSTRVERVEVVIHPQSIVHSMVEYADGSVLAQLGHPDMRTPIAHALSWPDRMGSGVQRLDLTAVGRLDFEPVDFERFPCLKLGYQAASAGGGASTVLNAANEVAVEAFLKERIRFTDIPRIIERTLERFSHQAPVSLESVLALDAEARAAAEAETAV
ncbi:MAG TPA: 1-deoxy-D-xylulose-5-phosphate reductoisomerase [Gammaproteobacteria bacterium]|nr:1-deoxy-D-xylulose-5-phosphate reductoisomerase [Gammaproteobacteria bacterium]